MTLFEAIALILSALSILVSIWTNCKVNTFIKNQNKTNQKNKEGHNTSQNHSGQGDNVGRDKNVK